MPLSIPNPDWRWLEFSGPDARDLLHRVTTADVNHLEVSHGTAGCLLNPLGKIQAFFYLWRLAETEWGFEVPTLFASVLRERLDALTFAERVEWKELPQDSGVSWVVSENDDLGLSTHALTRTSELLELPHMGWTSVVGNLKARQARLQEFAPLRGDALEQRRIASLLPGPGSEITDQVNPLEIGLRAAIAEQKGCYPGQEVIEKIISLGSPARRLGLLTGLSATPTTGTLLLDESGKELGAITSVGGGQALALLKKNAIMPLGRTFQMATGGTATLSVISSA